MTGSKSEEGSDESGGGDASSFSSPPPGRCASISFLCFSSLKTRRWWACFFEVHARPVGCTYQAQCARANARTFTHARTHAHTHTHTYARARAHSLTHARTRARTHAQEEPCRGGRTTHRRQCHQPSRSPRSDQNDRSTSRRLMMTQQEPPSRTKCATRCESARVCSTMFYSSTRSPSLFCHALLFNTIAESVLPCSTLQHDRRVCSTMFYFSTRCALHAATPLFYSAARCALHLSTSFCVTLQHALRCLYCLSSLFHTCTAALL